MIPVALPHSLAARPDEVATPDRGLPRLEPNLLGNGLPAGLLEYEAACDVCGQPSTWRSRIYTFTPLHRLTVSDSTSNVCHAVCDCEHDDAPLTELGTWLRNGEPLDVVEDVAA